MTEITVYTNDREINDIYTGLKEHVIRTDKIKAAEGNILNIRLVKNQREVYHQINRKKYVITHIEDWRTAPIFKHHQIITFKELKND